MEKNILITGANGAVGSVVTKHLISKGYKVIGIDNSLEKISGLLNTGNFIYHGADVTDEKEMNQLIPEIIKTEGQIHGALLLVGGFKYGGVFDTSLTSLTDMIRWNFFSAYNVARMVFQHMLEQSYGRIAFISSKQGIQPSIGSKTVG